MPRPTHPSEPLSDLLAHDDTGAGPTVLLLHSGVADRRMWSALAAHLSRGHRVLAPDLRGFGETPMPGAGTAYTDSADVAALLDRLATGPATVVGSSMGGRVAMELAVTRPDLVSSLVLMCAAWRGLAPTAAARAFGEEEDRLLESGDLDGAARLNAETWLGPEAGQQAHEAVSRMQRRAFELQLAPPEHPGPDPVEVDPTRIAVPALVVVGERDLDHFVAVGEHLAGAIASARLVRLAWAGHLPVLERPGEVVELVDGWLADLPAAKGGNPPHQGR